MEEIDPTLYGVVGYHENVAFGRMSGCRRYTWEVTRKDDESYRERESRIQGGIAKASMLSLDFSSRVCEGRSLEVVGGVRKGEADKF